MPQRCEPAAPQGFADTHFADEEFRLQDVSAALRSPASTDPAVADRAGLVHERHLIANELHDALAQNLTSIRLRTSLVRQAIGSGDDTRAMSGLDEIDRSLAVVHARVRELITHFRTQMDPRGLLHALAQWIEEMNRSGSVHIAFDCRVPELALATEQAQQVFCIVREALTNALKHSQGRRAQVAFARRDTDYEVTVEDDGIGMNPSAGGEHGHFGLNIMRERAVRLGGALEVSCGGEPGRERGVRVKLRFPVAPRGATSEGAT